MEQNMSCGMDFKELVRKNRSYRRFEQGVRISREELVELVDTARMTPSGANRQPLRYRLVNDPAVCADVYQTLGWAGYLKDWDGPVEGERPSAYIVLLAGENVSSATDEGIVAQTLLLGAVAKGYGGCMLGNVKRDALAKVLDLPAGMAIKLVVALGKPKEEIILDEIRADGDIKYYREPNQVHHVPKIALDDLIV